LFDKLYKKNTTIQFANVHVKSASWIIYGLFQFASGMGVSNCSCPNYCLSFQTFDLNMEPWHFLAKLQCWPFGLKMDIVHLNLLAVESPKIQTQFQRHYPSDASNNLKIEGSHHQQWYFSWAHSFIDFKRVTMTFFGSSMNTFDLCQLTYTPRRYLHSIWSYIPPIKSHGLAMNLNKLHEKVLLHKFLLMLVNLQVKFYTLKWIINPNVLIHLLIQYVNTKNGKN
jgi:hypothetical protein